MAADNGGYAEALKLAEEHAAGRRAFAVEGTGSFGAGLTRFLTAEGEQVFEVSRLRRERRSGGKTDALDAVRAARSVLDGKRARDPACQRRTRGPTRPAGRPRGSRERENSGSQPAPRPARHHPGAAPQRATSAQPGSPARPPHLRQTRPPNRSRAPRHSARPQGGRETHSAADGRGTRTRPRDRAAHLEARPPAARPARHRTTARGPVLLSWSHPGRLRSEAAFARLAGAAPIPASSGQTIRYRLDRSGDRKLNRTLHQIIVTRRRMHQPTIDYINRRIQEGKTRREATRCLKRYLARNLYRLLENPPATDLTNIEASLVLALTTVFVYGL